MLESALHPFSSPPGSPSSSSDNNDAKLTLSDLQHLLKYLPQTRRHLSTVRSVSKTWRYVVESAPNVPWCANGQIFIARGGQTVIYNAKRCSNNQPLTLSDGSTVLNDQLSFSLNSLSPVGRKMTNFCIRTLARNFEQCARGLAVLHLHYAHITPACFEALGQIDTLQELQLVSCREMTHLGEAKHCQSLRVLEATLCHLEPRPLEGLFLPNLRHLKISRSTQLETLYGVAEETFASLRYLCVEDCPMLADDGCQDVFPYLQHIETLDLSYTNISACVENLPIAGKNRLKALHLTNTNVTSETFENLAPDLRCLETLRMDSCEALGSLTFLEMIPNNRALGDSDDGTDSGAYRSLKILDVSRNDSSHWESIRTLKKLAALRLVGCGEVNPTFLAPTIYTMVSLDLSSTSTDDDAIVVFGTMKLLESLNVSHCSGVRSLSPLQHCKKLKRLFAAETHVDNRGVRALSSCVSLEQLDLSGISADDDDDYRFSAPADDLELNHLVVLQHLQVVNVFGSLRSESGIMALLNNGVTIISELIYGGSLGGE